MRRVSAISLLVLFALPAIAQEVGRRDLSVTSWKVPISRVNKQDLEKCSEVILRTADGYTMSNFDVPLEPTRAMPAEKESLRVSIVDVTPRQLQVGAGFEAALRIRNTGNSAVRLPWETDGGKVLRLSADGKEEDYSVVDIWLTFTTGHGRGSSERLRAGGALFADPELKEGFIEIRPGQWVDVKVDGKADCSKPKVSCTLGVSHDGAIVATWYERVRSHTIGQCNERYGSYIRRELDSAPFEMSVRPAVADKP